MNEYLNVIRNNYANFSGRARRREFWMFTLINGIVILVLEVPALLLGFNFSDPTSKNVSPVTFLLLGLIVIYVLAVLVPTVAVTVRRLHDAGFSGWLYLLSFVGLSLVVLVLNILDSKPGANKWGPNPKGVNAHASAF